MTPTELSSLAGGKPASGPGAKFRSGYRQTCRWVYAWVRHLTGAAAVGMGLLQSAVFAQQAEPDYFAGAEEAAPLTEADAESPPPTQAEVLRWKSPRAIVNPYVDHRVVKAAANEPAESEPAARNSADSTSSRDWNKTRINGHRGPVRSVRPAAHDPFSDPFGDRLTRSDEPTLTAPRYESEPAVAQQPETPAPGAGELPPPGQENAQPMPMAQRNYDPEMCRKWQEGCQNLAKTLVGDRITSISLNITPPYSQSPRESADDDEFRRQELAIIPSRDWRSKTGEVLATGRLGNIEFGNAIIVDDAGKEVARLALRELGKDEICFITFHWQLPYHCYADLEPTPRNWVAGTFTYQASNLCHKPLYFEEVQLERYGHTAGPIKQPLLSGAHFFCNIAVLPYKMAISPPMECEYPLGYYRPGSCAPWHIPPIPFSVRAALAEAGVWIGGIYVIP